jgi:hypothetical protein
MYICIIKRRRRGEDKEEMEKVYVKSYLQSTTGCCDIVLLKTRD